MLSNPLVSVLEWYHLWSLFSFWDCSGRGGPFFPLYGSVCFDEGLASQAARGPGWGCCPRGARLKWFPPHFAISGLPPSLFVGGAAWLQCGSCSEGHCRTKCETRERRGEKLRATPPGMGSPVWNIYIHPSDNKNVRVRRKQTNPKLRFLVWAKDTACQPPGGPDVGHCSTAVSLARCWHGEAALIPLERTHSGRMKSNDGSGQYN